MKHDTPLTQEQRYPIDTYRKAELNQTEKAEKLRVNKSTISREIRRNLGWRGDRAQRRCLARRAESHGSRIGVVVYGLVCKFGGHGMREVGPTPCPEEGPYHDREEA